MSTQETRATLDEAIAQGRRVTIQYLDTRLWLEPYRVDDKELVAYALDLHRARYFKLEFIREVVIVDPVDAA